MLIQKRKIFINAILQRSCNCCSAFNRSIKGVRIKNHSFVVRTQRSCKFCSKSGHVEKLVYYNTYFQFNVLPLGLTSVPYIFTTFTRPLIKNGVVKEKTIFKLIDLDVVIVRMLKPGYQVRV